MPFHKIVILLASIYQQSHAVFQYSVYIEHCMCFKIIYILVFRKQSIIISYLEFSPHNIRLLFLRDLGLQSCTAIIDPLDPTLQA